ncbi:MAG: hypothetical protein Q9227_001472 [Pyrenula ochraceoflavens]
MLSGKPQIESNRDVRETSEASAISAASRSVVFITNNLELISQKALNTLGTLEEPLRTVTWLLACFEEKPGHSIPQKSIYRSYLVSSRQSTPLIPPEFLKGIMTAFPRSRFRRTPFESNNYLVIGIVDRHHESFQYDGDLTRLDQSLDSEAARCLARLSKGVNLPLHLADPSLASITFDDAEQAAKEIPAETLKKESCENTNEQSFQRDVNQPTASQLLKEPYDTVVMESYPILSGDTGDDLAPIGYGHDGDTPTPSPVKEIPTLSPHNADAGGALTVGPQHLVSEQQTFLAAENCGEDDQPDSSDSELSSPPSHLESLPDQAQGLTGNTAMELEPTASTMDRQLSIYTATTQSSFYLPEKSMLQTFDFHPIFVARVTRDVPQSSKPRLAGVQSLGISGNISNPDPNLASLIHSLHEESPRIVELMDSSPPKSTQHRIEVSNQKDIRGIGDDDMSDEPTSDSLQAESGRPALKQVKMPSLGFKHQSHVSRIGESQSRSFQELMRPNQPPGGSPEIAARSSVSRHQENHSRKRVRIDILSDSDNEDGQAQRQSKLLVKNWGNGLCRRSPPLSDRAQSDEDTVRVIPPTVQSLRITRDEYQTIKKYDGPKPRVTFTVSNVANDKTLIAHLRKHSGSVNSTVSRANIVCVGDQQLRRTSKLLLGIVKGKTLVCETWLIESHKANCLLNLEPFFPKEPQREEEWNFNLHEAVSKGPSLKSVLRGKTISLTRSFRNHLGELLPEYRTLIKALGAKSITESLPPRSARRQNYLLIGTDEDKDNQTLLLSGWPIWSRDMLTMTVLRSKLQISQEFLICGPFRDDDDEGEL